MTSPNQGGKTPAPSSPIGSVSSNSFISEALAFQPAFKNLFEVTFGDLGPEGYETKFFCHRVSLPGTKISFERPKNFYEFFMEGVTPISEITIDWQETETYDVRRYHEEWLSLFWDRDTFRYQSTPTEKSTDNRYRTATIHVFSSSNSRRSMSVQLIKLLPTQIPDLLLGFDSADAVEYSITYKVTKHRTIYHDL